MMKPSTEDQLKGTLHEVKGAAKEKAGQVIGNPDLEAEGLTEKIAGTIRRKSARSQRFWRSSARFQADRF